MGPTTGFETAKSFGANMDLDDIIDKYARSPREKERVRIISEALGSVEGRKKLAEAMGEAIRRKLRREY